MPSQLLAGRIVHAPPSPAQRSAYRINDISCSYCSIVSCSSSAIIFCFRHGDQSPVSSYMILEQYCNTTLHTLPLHFKQNFRFVKLFRYQSCGKSFHSAINKSSIGNVFSIARAMLNSHCMPASFCRCSTGQSFDNANYYSTLVVTLK